MIDIDALKKIYAANPDQLPALIIHTNDQWTSAPFVDSTQSIHMNQRQLMILKEDVPIKFVKQLSVDVMEFAINLAPHHFDGVGGTGVAASQRMPSLRSLTGQDRETFH